MKLNAIPEVKRLSLNIQAADALRLEICNGNIAPGTKLTEIEISSQMGLSRSTVRSALQQLMAEGLVTQTPYTAWEVTSLDPQDVWEIYSLRGSMEGFAARLAANAIDASGRRELDKALASLRAACASRDVVAVADADFGLHRAIISLSGHRRLRDQYRLIEFQVRMCIASSNGLLPDVATVVTSHLPIINAIKAGDADLAERLSRDFNIEHGTELQKSMTASTSR